MTPNICTLPIEQQTPIDMAHLLSGTYIITVLNGGSTYQVKLLKE